MQEIFKSPLDVEDVLLDRPSERNQGQGGKDEKAEFED
jgi:hypothetical protein